MSALAPDNATLDALILTTVVSELVAQKPGQQLQAWKAIEAYAEHGRRKLSDACAKAVCIRATPPGADLKKVVDAVIRRSPGVVSRSEVALRIAVLCKRLQVLQSGPIIWICN